MNIHLTMGMRSGTGMIKYKLYTFSGVMYVVPVDKYEYIDDISTTEHFYYDVQYCYERALDVSECIDELFELQGETK